MAFLHSVLKDVHDRQPYSVGKITLQNDVVKHLKDKLCSGHEGFKSVIDFVAQGVGGYNREVREGNGKVKKPINEFLRHINDRFKNEVSIILENNFVPGTKMSFTPVEVKQAEEAVQSVNNKLEDSLRTTMVFTEAMDAVVGDIAHLNHELKLNVNNAVIAMQRELDVLHYSCQTQSFDLKGVIKMVGEQFSELNNKVNAETKTNVEKLVNDLKQKIMAFRQEIQNVKQPLEAWILSAEAQLADSETYVAQGVETFEKNYPLINKALGEIKNIAQPLSLPFNLKTPFDKSSLEIFNDSVRQKIKMFPKAVEADIDNLKRQLTKLINDYVTGLSDGEVYAGMVYEFVNDVLDNAINTLVPEVKKPAVGDKYKPLNIKIEKFMENLKNEQSQIDEMITSVERDILNLRTQSANTNDPDSKLNPFVGTMQAQMKTLKIKLDDLILLVEAADDKLNAWISTVDAYIATIDGLRDTCVKQLESYVNASISYAQSMITTYIRKRYVRSMKLMLEAFATKAIDVLSPLPTLVENDKHIGFKGFMETIDINFNSKFESHTTKKSLSDLASAFTNFYSGLKAYIHEEIRRVHKKEREKKNPLPPDAEPYYANKLLQVTLSLIDLLMHIHSNKRYDHKLPEKLDKLAAAVDELKPDGFERVTTPVLDSIVSGVGMLENELRKVYISTYSLQKQQEADATKYAKILLTALPIMMTHLGELKQKCDTAPPDGWKFCRLYLSSKARKNPMGDFLHSCGYVVPSDIDKQDGELQCHLKMAGNDIGMKLLRMNIVKAVDIPHLPACVSHVKMKTHINVIDIIECMFTHLQEYSRVCHLTYIPTPAAPTSVYKMLIWLSGFWYNPMYEKVTMYVRQLFDKPKEESKLQDPSNYKLDATRPFNATTITDTLSDVCEHAEKTLVAILGFGHADGEYAVGFTDNSHKLMYPSSPSQCLDLLFEILCRVYHQLNFVYEQCRHGQLYGGWNSCWYGRGVAGSAWDCNSMQCPNQPANQIADQNSNQNHDQMCNQKCDQNPKCGLKSPLQSFLEDGLPGFLPHSFTAPNCKITCQMPKHFGLPCKTPMGFADIATAASHCKTGDHIMNVLSQFCGKEHSVLGQLCSFLQCLLQRTPQTLDEMFAFYYGLLNGWDDNDKQRQKHKRYAFDDAVTKAYFNERYDGLDISPMFNSNDGLKNIHANGNLLCLTSCNNNPASFLTCGPYLQPLCQNTWTVFSEKRADKYLSWIVYLTETFYDLLKMLYEECCSKCDKRGTKCYEKCSIAGCPVKYPDASKKGSDEYKTKFQTYQTSRHTKECTSIVKCKHTRPTLYKYGFNFENTLQVRDQYNIGRKRTCRDLCNALDRVLSIQKADEPALAKLIYETIPNFLWKIREPFSLTLLALWSLSLLYLLHIAVVRLDVLRIRSHLRSPSSHRIAAQSLLAAARVKALANVKYFSP
ncbi:hypothetical protein, conserved [Babesia ovata]|uniref:C3H1-type domain-containing protein n=1 Tax=Babesia ovata TaxID=189622 RepID=A0A2H6KK49_9APIC|nr:uncharacterized protein BOVATA_048540 [Babesia ovata]GBE63361.1 hypothetical protein, conserved [Babesia ovata]